MKRKRLLSVAPVALVVALVWATSALAEEVDGDAARALAKANDCFKCHSVDKKKDAPSFKETAAKLKGQAGAEAEIYKHLTTGPMVKVDGKEEKHTIVDSKDEAAIRNLARWILSR